MTGLLFSVDVCVPAFIKPNISLPLNHVKLFLLINLHKYLSVGLMIRLLTNKMDSDLHWLPCAYLANSNSLLQFKSTLDVNVYVFQTNMGCYGAEGNTNKAEFLEWPLLPPHHSNAAPSSPGFIMTLPVLILVNQGFDRKKKIRLFYDFLNRWWHVFGRFLRVTWYLAGVAWTRWQPEERRATVRSREEAWMLIHRVSRGKQQSCSVG